MYNTSKCIEGGFAGVYEIQARYTDPLGIITKLVLLRSVGGKLKQYNVELTSQGLSATYINTAIDLARKRTGSKTQHGPTTIRGTGFNGMQEILFTCDNLAFFKTVILRACKTAKAKRGNVISLIGDKVTIVQPIILGIVKTQ